MSIAVASDSLFSRGQKTPSTTIRSGAVRCAAALALLKFQADLPQEALRLLHACLLRLLPRHRTLALAPSSLRPRCQQLVPLGVCWDSGPGLHAGPTSTRAACWCCCVWCRVARVPSSAASSSFARLWSVLSLDIDFRTRALAMARTAVFQVLCQLSKCVGIAPGHCRERSGRGRAMCR